MTTVTEKQACRACGQKFSDRVLLNFGEQEIVDFLEPGETGRGRAPLELVQCPACELVQLRHTVDPDTLYKKFWYRSSINSQMRAALADIVCCATAFYHSKNLDWACDIGANDGELLGNYPGTVNTVGFEPATALATEAAKRLQDTSSLIVPDYFNSKAALAASGGRLYNIVTAIAMFYDLDDPRSFLLDVKRILADDGVFVIQMNYLGTMIRNLAFDNISHEHLCYYSLTTLKKLLDSCGLAVFDLELNGVNGGSIRAYISHQNARTEDRSVRDLLLVEAMQLTEGSVKYFSERVQTANTVLLNFLKALKSAHKTVYAYGASTRGMTLLQCLFGNEKATDYLLGAAEKDVNKYGKRMAGLNLPIVSEEEARDKADYMLVLPYHFWQSIRSREYDWMKSGGKMILPLPFPKVMGASGISGWMPVDLTEELEGLRA